MKKMLRLIVCTLALVCVFPMSVFAAEPMWEAKENNAAPIGVFVETVEEDLISCYNYSNMPTPKKRATVDLSQGSSHFTVGTLDANQSYTTDTYKITKTTLKIGLQSITRPSKHIKVVLYKSNGTSVAETTVSLPQVNPIGGSTTYISFTNLSTSNNYYAKIKNTDTATSGNIFGVAKQAQRNLGNNMIKADSKFEVEY